MITTSPETSDRFAQRAFCLAGCFLLIVAALGTLLRIQWVVPFSDINYTFILHAHSHVAFLGWIFNAFFALALRFFVPTNETRFYHILFWALQVPLLGMLLSFPIQGYAVGSIIFSTLHMTGAVIFCGRLWFHNRAVPGAQGHLRVALAFMMVSGLGPLSLGPLAASGLRDSSAYHLMIYFYLHFQYNGWFIFFLLAVFFQHLGEEGRSRHELASRHALRWLAAGTVLTVAQSALGLFPLKWVYAVAAAGGAGQLVGCAFLVRAVRGSGSVFQGPARLLGGVALAGFLLKNILQAASAWPPLADLVNNRFTIIGFLHLVFLCVVTPLLFAWAQRLGWLPRHRMSSIGLGLFFAGAVFTECVLISVPLAGVFRLPSWPHLPPTLLGAALVMLAGAILLVAALSPGRFIPARQGLSRAG